jgi:hypothetical protein
VTVSEFWGLTPRETYMVIEAAIWRNERRQQELMALAWNTAALTRAKRMPRLRTLLASRSGPATEEEMQALREKHRQLKKRFEPSWLPKKLRSEHVAG